MLTTPSAASPFAAFCAALQQEGGIAVLREAVIGNTVQVTGPFGPRRLVYADYVASGRALGPVERFVQDEVLPYYANSHTETSYCGGLMTRLREQARAIIGRSMGCDPALHAVVFAGAGATAGLNRIVHLLGLGDSVAKGEDPVVLLGPYEHHSNILPWRETGAEVIEIEEDAAGGPSPAELHRHLAALAGRRPVIGAFSAASNVSGIITDVAAVTRLLKAAGARVVWDYAGGAPYLPIAMTPAADAAIDAIALSPHKFVGGPGASGVFAIRRDAVRACVPSQPGGGTVRFVSPWGHDYNETVEGREEGGTPNIIGDLRAALAVLVKEAIGLDFITRRDAELAHRGLEALAVHERIEMLGATHSRRLPIFSFRVRDGHGGYHHQHLITQLMSDLYGIQARGGCACAGPYGHRLLQVERQASEALRAQVLAGHEIDKLGFVRFNLSYLMADDEVDFILKSVGELACMADRYADCYEADGHSGVFTPRVKTFAAPGRLP